MKAIVCNEFGPIEQLSLEDRPDPVAGAGQVLIEIHAAGVNFPDGLMVRGEYQVKPPRPFTPGSEVAGIVRGVGDGVSGFAPGDRVVALPGLGHVPMEEAPDASVAPVLAFLAGEAVEPAPPGARP